MMFLAAIASLPLGGVLALVYWFYSKQSLILINNVRLEDIPKLSVDEMRKYVAQKGLDYYITDDGNAIF
jgi:hypothetical protein